jgi:hypothetical protein
VESGVVSAEKLASLRQEWSQREAVRHRRAARTGERFGERESMQRADRDFRYHPEASKNFLMESPTVAAHPLRLPSSFFLSLEVRGEESRRHVALVGNQLYGGRRQAKRERLGSRAPTLGMSVNHKASTLLMH